MKLFLCQKCGDVVRCIEKKRTCKCKKSWGRYIDELYAEYGGEHAVPLGFDNSSLTLAVRAQPESGWGQRFDAFVIAKECDTFKKVLK
jgi:hypothetical protein